MHFVVEVTEEWRKQSGLGFLLMEKKVGRLGQKLLKIMQCKRLLTALGSNTEFKMIIFSLLRYHGPFGVLFPAGGIVMRILLIELCVIRVCFLYNLKQNGR